MCELRLLSALGQFRFVQKVSLCTAAQLSVQVQGDLLFILLPLPLFIDNSEGLFNFPIRHLRQHFCVKHKPPLCDSITAASFLFCYYDWSLMSKIHVTDCVNTAAWYLSSFAPDLWKSWTWCVLICLCALCIVCSHMSVRPCRVLRSLSRVLEGKLRGRRFSIQFHRLGLVAMRLFGVLGPPEIGLFVQ